MPKVALAPNRAQWRGGVMTSSVEAAVLIGRPRVGHYGGLIPSPAPVQPSSAPPGSIRRARWRRVLRTSVLTPLYTLWHYLDAAVPMALRRSACAARLSGVTSKTAARTQRCSTGERLTRYRDNPQLWDSGPETTPYDPHDTHQDAWAARAVFSRAASAACRRRLADHLRSRPDGVHRGHVRRPPTA